MKTLWWSISPICSRVHIVSEDREVESIAEEELGDWETSYCGEGGRA
jgi:hypothetical protein